MAGRQKHVKSFLSERSEYSYKSKLTGIFSTYAGANNAERWVNSMYENYKKTFADIYHKVHEDPGVQDVINTYFGRASRFLAYQIINETIFAVLLTRSETGTVVSRKYERQGVDRTVVNKLMYATTLAVMNIVPRVAAGIMKASGGVALSSGNIAGMLTTYVMSGPPLPASSAGIAGETQTPTVPETYAGTTTFSTSNAGLAGLQEIRSLTLKKQLEAL